MSLELYLGPMYAGKTTKMIKMFHNSPLSHKIAVDFNTESSHGSHREVIIERKHEEQCVLHLRMVWKLC